MSRTFAKKYSRAAIFSYLFHTYLCFVLLVVSMTIIPRVRGSLALSCCFAEQPWLLPIWESDCRSWYLIQVFIFIASLYPTSTTWFLQVAVLCIASCLLPWEWCEGQRHPILKRSIFWLVEEDTLSTEGLTQRISFTWCKVTPCPIGIPHSALQPGLVPGRMEEEAGHSGFVPCVVLVCAEPEPWLAPAPISHHQVPTWHSLCLATSSFLGTGCHFLSAQLFKHENNVFLIFWTVYCSIYISISFNVIIILVFYSRSFPFSCFLHPTSRDSQQFLKCPAAILWYIILYISLLSLSIQSGTCNWAFCMIYSQSCQYLLTLSVHLFFFFFSWLFPSNFPWAASFHSYLLPSFPPTTPSFLSWIHLCVI